MVDQADLEQRRARLSPAQRAWLERRLQGIGPTTGDGDAIPRRPSSADPAPLSSTQWRLWFLERLYPGNPVYTIPLALRLAGRLDAAALERSLAEIVRRHAILRTTFPEVDGWPVQAVREALAVPLPVEKLKRTLREAFNDQLEAYVRLRVWDEVRRPFDLANDLPLRATLLRLDRRDHVLLLTLHHLVSDGWSMGILFRELGALYPGFVAGHPSPLPELPLQYADYAAWQRDRLERGALDEQLAYWKRRLAGMEELDLPRDRPRPEVETHRGARQEVTIPGSLVSRLRALAQREGATLYMALLAAFQALLARYVGQDDIAVGSPIAGRTRVETEGLIGFFVNTLVLRTDLGGDPTFRELLGRARETALGAYAHQEIPFERLVAELRPERGLGRTPLTPVMLALQNAPRPPLALPNLTVSRLSIDPGTTAFDLSLDLREIDGDLRGVFEYSTDLFDQATIERLVGHLRTLLAGAVADPDSRLSTLPLLTPSERARLIVEGKVGATDLPPSATVPELFTAQAERAPGAVAIVGDDGMLTYRELDRRANRLAHHLRRLGVGPDVVVGLCLERSPALVVGMLGIVKAGGAYLPLDPADPPERLAFMLDDARAPVLVTEAGLAERLPTVAARPVRLDADAAAIAREADTAPAGAATPEHLAYVIYTSGSTGTPKGVAVPHRAVTRLVVGADYVRLTPDDVVAQVANAAFDAATFEVWGALLNGARLVVLPRDVALSPPQLAAAIARHGITTLFLTTALFNLLAGEAPTALRGVRQVLFGGEAADVAAVVAVLEHGPPERLLHVYGPTETTTFATWHLVERVEPGATTIPIGRPITGARATVVDRNNRLVPIGVPGELLVGGAGVARGYLHRPELTAGRFVADPDGPELGARWFRTGDRVRWRPDGALEFLGRFDEQVKIRGFRVEPGEVESALRRHPAVREAAVVARRDGSGGARLVAYVVLAAEPAPAPIELRGFLKATLPDSMVPTAFVAIAALPLTANGKVDRRSLPVPEEGQAAVDGEVPPRTPTEAALARIWAELVGVERVGIHDDFFALGGHSLLVAQAIARLRVDLGVELPVRSLFEAPTVAELAGRVEAARRQATAGDGAPQTSSGAMVPLRSDGERPPLFLVPGGGGGARNLFKLAQLARQLGPDQPCYGFLSGEFKPEGEDVQASVEAMAAGYLTELRGRQPEGPYLLGGTCVGGVLAFEMARQLFAGGEQVAGLFLLDTVCPNGDYAEVAERLRQRRRERAAGRARGGASRDRRRPPPGANLEPLAADAAVGGMPDTPVPGTAAWPSGDDDLPGRGMWLYRYRPRPYPGRITLFLNEEWHGREPALGWEAVAAGDLDVRPVAGSHGSYLVENLHVVADQLRACLDELWTPAAGERA